MTNLPVAKIEAENKLSEIKESRQEIIVHAVRIAVKTGMVMILIWSQSPHAFSLSLYIIISEIIEQINLYIMKIKPDFKNIVKIFYVLNSVTVISIVAFFANWVLNDFYLIYLIHISSATVGYGYRMGLFSFTLSILCYSYLLFIDNAAFETYIRLPLLSVLAFRLFVSQNRFEKTSNFLQNVLNVEKSKQDFIALASHNLRTPVAAIYGYIDLILRKSTGQLNDQQTLFMNRIKSNNQELEKITESLLQISIFEIGKEINLFRQPSQTEVLIEDIVEQFSSVAKSKDLELVFNKQPGLVPLVDIDVEKIKSVLSNLIDNGLKYTEKGGVYISLAVEQKFIAVSVKDTGVGIPKEELSKVFNKFYRSGNILVYNQIGTGLGLYLGKQIIEKHGGKITVNSVAGQGTIFTVYLPIIEDQGP